MTATEEQSGDESVIVECELDAPPEKVWRALTVPELLATWIDMPQPTQGCAPAYTIIDAQPYASIRYAWHDATASEQDTVVSIELSPQENSKTWFRLTHEPRRAAIAANGNAPPLMIAA